MTLFFFLGATGKSAQIPLYVWLPDAMAGPTPVSALIHAATMVTAGVYMVARLNFLFSMAPGTMEFVATVGSLTALFAATIGVAQNDIKKVLAYSTVSQLGYMFAARRRRRVCGGRLPSDDACVLQGLPVPRRGLGHPRDGRRAGHAQDGRAAAQNADHVHDFLVATLAISGIPPFAGFMSKDEIIWQAFAERPRDAVVAAVDRARD